MNLDIRFKWIFVQIDKFAGAWASEDFCIAKADGESILWIGSLFLFVHTSNQVKAL